jgi:hypothetical protein
MKKDHFLLEILHRLLKPRKTGFSDRDAQDSAAMLKKVLFMVEDTDEFELGCDEVFELMDLYVELEARGEDVQTLFPFVKKHLDRCQDCREEYEALASILSAG